MNRPATEEMRRLRWQCRRGLLELDLVLQRFLDERYAELDVAGQESFRHLLSQPDTQLLAWLQSRQVPPPEFDQIVMKITE